MAQYHQVKPFSAKGGSIYGEQPFAYHQYLVRFL